jgi:hypothetical protein
LYQKRKQRREIIGGSLLLNKQIEEAPILGSTGMGLLALLMVPAAVRGSCLPNYLPNNYKASSLHYFLSYLKENDPTFKSSFY